MSPLLFLVSLVGVRAAYPDETYKELVDGTGYQTIMPRRNSFLDDLAETDLKRSLRERLLSIGSEDSIDQMDREEKNRCGRLVCGTVVCLVSLAIILLVIFRNHL